MPFVNLNRITPARRLLPNTLGRPFVRLHGPISQLKRRTRVFPATGGFFYIAFDMRDSPDAVLTRTNLGEANKYKQTPIYLALEMDRVGHCLSIDEQPDVLTGDVRKSHFLTHAKLTNSVSQNLVRNVPKTLSDPIREGRRLG
jgi:hypothetical protein